MDISRRPSRSVSREDDVSAAALLLETSSASRDVAVHKRTDSL